MAYGELIKNFEKIREYLRQFYVYGFRSRDEFSDLGDRRSYDNERRRVQSWLDEYYTFRNGRDGKQVFLSVDSRSVVHNPLYRAFKTKTFTRNDIVLHFYIMDILKEHGSADQNEIMDALDQEYGDLFEGNIPDERTVRNKLNELEELGILNKQRLGKRTVFSVTEDKTDLSGWWDAIAFYSEAAPLGVVGSFLLDKTDEDPEYYRFKHNYIMHAIDSEILCGLIIAIDEKKTVNITVNSLGQTFVFDNVPLKIYVSTETGREYLLSWNRKDGRFVFTRIDRIVKVKLGKGAPDWDEIEERYKKEQDHIWGVSYGGLEKVGELEHITFELKVNSDEPFIIDRLEREKRCGSVIELEEGRWLFSADVYDAKELLSWINTFIGRITAFKCSNPSVTEKFYTDLERMAASYE